MNFKLVLTSELPFSLKLPTASYQILYDGNVYNLELLQNQFAGFNKVICDRPLGIGTLEQLKKNHDSINVYFKLNTIIKLTFDIASPLIVNPSYDDIIGYLVSKNLKREDNYETIEDDAKSYFDSLCYCDKCNLNIKVSKIKTAELLFDLSTLTDIYIKLINKLIRYYSTLLYDRFVYELSLYHYRLGITNGIYILYVCDDLIIYNINYALLFHGLIKGEWAKHTQQEISGFVASLGSDLSLDSIDLMLQRADSALERGDFRKSVLESNCAIETMIDNILESAMKSAGKKREEIEYKLNDCRFISKANAMMRTYGLPTVSSLNKELWKSILISRKLYRDAVVHSDYMPNKDETATTYKKIKEIIVLMRTAYNI